MRSALTMFSAISCTGLLVSCAATIPLEPNVVIQKVMVPVVTDCKITWPDKPTTNVGALAKPASLYLSAQAIMKELEEYRAYAGALEAALSKCATMRPVVPPSLPASSPPA